jgi:hypothetical protein
MKRRASVLLTLVNATGASDGLRQHPDERPCGEGAGPRPTRRSTAPRGAGEANAAVFRVGKHARKSHWPKGHQTVSKVDGDSWLNYKLLTAAGLCKNGDASVARRVCHEYVGKSPSQAAQGNERYGLHGGHGLFGCHIGCAACTRVVLGRRPVSRRHPRQT